MPYTVIIMRVGVKKGSLSWEYYEEQGHPNRWSLNTLVSTLVSAQVSGWVK